jgi:low temperature requirement protein LtrA
MPPERIIKRKKSVHIKREDSLSRPTSLVASSEAEGKGKQHRVKKYMFKKPAPLNSWETEEHRSESWFELFIDLFYVAFFIKLGDIFYTCGFTVDTVLHVCAVFLGIYMSKFDFDQYMNKFEGEDLVHKIFFLFYALGNVIMILNVNETSEV